MEEVEARIIILIWNDNYHADTAPFLLFWQVQGISLCIS